MHLLWVLPLAVVMLLLVWLFFFSVRGTVNAGERGQGRCLRDDDPDCGEYTDDR